VSSWAELEAEEPDFAARVRARFDSSRHKTMATLRLDGSPRISGIELEFGEDVTFGVMNGSRKEHDLLRDPRVALHSASPDPPADDPGGWEGDAKISGRALEAGGEGHRLFRVDLEEVVLTRVGTPSDNLLIESWHPGRGRERRERR